VQCAHPVWVRQGNRRREVPCGSCVSCRIARAREWAIRCVHEATLHEASGFVTLTYSDDFLPADQAVSQDELQRFFKRLRRALGNRPVRYFACGEYGERFGRPHYHAAVFGLPSCSCPDWGPYEGGEKQVIRCGCEGREAVMKAWTLGGVSRVSLVCYDSARYIADYVGKADMVEQGYEGKARPFQIMSKGLGRGYVDLHGVDLRFNLGVNVRGNEMGLPRYYADRLGSYFGHTKEAMKEKVNASKAPASKVATVWSGEADERVFNVALPRLQREADAIARQKLFKKGKE